MVQMDVRQQQRPRAIAIEPLEQRVQARRRPGIDQHAVDDPCADDPRDAEVHDVDQPHRCDAGRGLVAAGLGIGFGLVLGRLDHRQDCCRLDVRIMFVGEDVLGLDVVVAPRVGLRRVFGDIRLCLAEQPRPVAGLLERDRLGREASGRRVGERQQLPRQLAGVLDDPVALGPDPVGLGVELADPLLGAR